ncbi:MAG TPA: hypothetical protein VG186_04435 [Solirubrobacteraceae bacterium]|jgi:hypothetical protein|nr:hypothetical protein [Solirubrobacteraceae bacterium]
MPPIRTDIFLLVPRLVSPVLAAAVALAVSASGAAAASKPATHKKKKKGPTAAQKLAAAVKTAEHSPDLWATVNVCTSMPAPTNDSVGIRGQMPSLGVPATLSMNISVSYWDGSAFATPPMPVTDTISLGMGTHGLHQGGVNFTIIPPTPGATYVVRGAITFEWKIGTKVVGKVTKNTGHGYANVGFSSPPGFSAGTCTLT